MGETSLRCSMTGLPLKDTSEGIFDDGEWISWAWINGQLENQELRHQFPSADVEVIRIFQDLVALAENYFHHTGRYLQIWGELGELYAEIQYGVKRHRVGTPGSDGRIGNDWIEVKTISPEKLSDVIHVKRAGNFNKLLVVRIDKEFQFDARLIDRRALGKGLGKHAKYRWDGDDK